MCNCLWTNRAQITLTSWLLKSDVHKCTAQLRQRHFEAKPPRKCHASLFVALLYEFLLPASYHHMSRAQKRLLMSSLLSTIELNTATVRVAIWGDKWQERKAARLTDKHWIERLFRICMGDASLVGPNALDSSQRQDRR